MYTRYKLQGFNLVKSAVLGMRRLIWSWISTLSNEMRPRAVGGGAQKSFTVPKKWKQNTPCIAD